jgi:hypothetical protein
MYIGCIINTDICWQVKGEWEVRGKVICGEENAMIVFHERNTYLYLTIKSGSIFNE